MKFPHGPPAASSKNCPRSAGQRLFQSAAFQTFDFGAIVKGQGFDFKLLPAPMRLSAVILEAAAAHARLYNLARPRLSFFSFRPRSFIPTQPTTIFNAPAAATLNTHQPHLH
jgi:hypothetical protein